MISELLLDSFCVLEKNILLRFFVLDVKPVEEKKIRRKKTYKKKKKGMTCVNIYITPIILQSLVTVLGTLDKAVSSNRQ